MYKSFSLQNVWEKIWDNLLRFPLTVSGKDHMIKKLRVIIIFYHIIYYQGFFLTYNWGWIIHISYFKYKNMEEQFDYNRWQFPCHVPLSLPWKTEWIFSIRKQYIYFLLLQHLDILHNRERLILFLKRKNS